MAELKWEEIKHDNGFYLRRTKVFGGWLVCAMGDVSTYEDLGYDNLQRQQGMEYRQSITFVPDLNYEWKIE